MKLRKVGTKLLSGDGKLSTNKDCCCCDQLDLCAEATYAPCVDGCERIVKLRIGWAAPPAWLRARAGGRPLRYEVRSEDADTGRLLLAVDNVLTARDCHDSAPLARETIFADTTCFQHLVKLWLRVLDGATVLIRCDLDVDLSDEHCVDLGGSSQGSDSSGSSSSGSSSSPSSGSRSQPSGSGSHPSGSGGGGGSGSGGGGPDGPDDGGSSSSPSSPGGPAGCCHVEVAGLATTPCVGGETSPPGTITLAVEAVVSTPEICASCTRGSWEWRISIGGSSIATGHGENASAEFSRPCTCAGDFTVDVEFWCGSALDHDFACAGSVTIPSYCICEGLDEDGCDCPGRKALGLTCCCPSDQAPTGPNGECEPDPCAR
jgi:hypothetical protein